MRIAAPAHRLAERLQLLRRRTGAAAPPRYRCAAAALLHEQQLGAAGAVLGVLRERLVELAVGVGELIGAELRVLRDLLGGRIAAGLEVDDHDLALSVRSMRSIVPRQHGAVDRLEAEPELRAHQRVPARSEVVEVLGERLGEPPGEPALPLREPGRLEQQLVPAGLDGRPERVELRLGASPSPQCMSVPTFALIPEGAVPIRPRNQSSGDLEHCLQRAGETGTSSSPSYSGRSVEGASSPCQCAGSAPATSSAASAASVLRRIGLLLRRRRSPGGGAAARSRARRVSGLECPRAGGLGQRRQEGEERATAPRRR